MRRHSIEELLRNRKTDEVRIERVDGSQLDCETMETLILAARRGFGRPQMPREEVTEHALGADMLHLIHFRERLVGFAAYSVFDMKTGMRNSRRVLYLNGIVMDREAQGNGIAAVALLEAIRQEDPQALALRTQNPAMYSATGKIVSGLGLVHRLFPSLSYRPDKEAKRIARNVSNILNEKHYDATRFFDSGTYGMALNDSVPRVNPEVEELFAQLKLDREAGDSIIVVAMLSKGARTLRTRAKEFTGRMMERLGGAMPLYPGM